MTNSKSKITVSNSEALRVLSENLNYNEDYTPKELRLILIENFEGITPNQQTSLIYRATNATYGILEKTGRLYRLRAEERTDVDCVGKAKTLLQEYLHRIDSIPSSEVETVEQFEELMHIKNQISLLINKG
ncbi:hypothetical protein [Bacillus toyonensis]|uniref:hypothetical protein n=1 Tax=Bacillus toyonensis TaxID=155322 RepID=UPI000BF4AE0A|nr:hypothetical protein [Bacillus toyonensis]PGF05334.1 hypothetical protein COM61_02680 [Bacillus toyonensis]